MNLSPLTSGCRQTMVGANIAVGMAVGMAASRCLGQVMAGKYTKTSGKFVHVLETCIIFPLFFTCFQISWNIITNSGDFA